MTAVTGKNFAVGLRFVQIWALNDYGSPAATSTAPYGGLHLEGAQTFEVTIPDPNKIVHVGDDRVMQTDFLPTREAIDATLTVGRQDLDIYALISGNKAVTVGEAKMALVGSDNQGSEAQVGMLLFQQALDENGLRNYQYWMFPKALIYQHPGSMNESPMAHQYKIAPQVCQSYPWEAAFTEADAGALEGQAIIGQSHYKPRIVSWLATVSSTEFLLETEFPGISTAAMAIWVDGDPITDATKTTTGFSLATSPGKDKRVVCFYEHAS